MKRITKTARATHLGDRVSLARQLAGGAPLRAPATLLPAVLKRVGLADRYWRLESPLGTVCVAHSKAGISMVARAGSPAEFERAFEKRFGRPIVREHAPARMAALVRKVKSPERRKLRYDLRGLSEFERAVLMKALEIPDGEVRPYSWIAKEIGRPDAVRAVGTALGKNPVPLLIPCHRVVRTDGSIGRYSMGGSRAKRRLLTVEGAHPETIERLAAQGVRYLGNAEKGYYCYPTCGGDVDRLVLLNRLHIHDDREARAAGLTPCEDCRPLARAS